MTIEEGSNWTRLTAFLEENGVKKAEHLKRVTEAFEEFGCEVGASSISFTRGLSKLGLFGFSIIFTTATDQGQTKVSVCLKLHGSENALHEAIGKGVYHGYNPQGEVTIEPVRAIQLGPKLSISNYYTLDRPETAKKVFVNLLNGAISDGEAMRRTNEFRGSKRLIGQT